MDFELLEEIIEDLDKSDSKIMKQYLVEGRLFKEIADDEGRTYEAIKKLMERICAEITIGKRGIRIIWNRAA